VFGEAMTNIESGFNERFAHWEIRLPPDDIERRKRGKIVKAGWAIWYLFGSDEKGEYLDYYASHRMTNDWHERIYADGRSENLPTIGDMRPCSKDPEEDAQLEAEYFAENQRVAKMLEEKGFGLAGDEPGGVQVNRYLHINKFDG
jgi:hypothetical protein